MELVDGIYFFAFSSLFLKESKAVAVLWTDFM